MFEEFKQQISALAEQYKQIMAALTGTTPPPVEEKAAPVKNISGSVGNKGDNNKADVILVQQLLNKRMNAGLSEDGACGKLTIAAIVKFQQTVVGSSKPDGRIDVGGKTWQHLSGGSSPTPNTGGNTNPTPKPDPVVIVPTGKEIPNPQTPAPNAKLPQATEIIRTGAWANGKRAADAAARITATPEQVAEIIAKSNAAGSPCFLESKPRTEVKGAEGIPADVKAYVQGKAQIARSKQTRSELDKVYGYVDPSKITIRELKIEADPKAKAAFAANITSVKSPLFNNKSISVHKKVAASLKMALDEIFSFYGAEKVQALGLNSFSGSWVFRNTTISKKKMKDKTEDEIRAMVTPSTHAWGIAIDICATFNGYEDTGGDALFAQAPYQAFVDILEKYGWYSLGRWSSTGFDFMHFQAALV